MANYSVLKAAVQAVVKTNGNQEITGANMQSTLISIINSLGTGYQFMGVATPSTSPGTPDYNVAYIGGAGTYANFGTSVTVPVGSICVFKYNGSWVKEQIALFAGIDTAPAQDSTNLIISGAVAELQKETTGVIGVAQWHQGNINGNTGVFAVNSKRVTNYTPVISKGNIHVICTGDVRANSIQQFKSDKSPVSGGTMDVDFISYNDPSSDIVIEKNDTYPNVYVTFVRKSDSSSNISTSEVAENVTFIDLGSLAGDVAEHENRLDELDTDIENIENRLEPPFNKRVKELFLIGFDNTIEYYCQAYYYASNNNAYVLIKDGQDNVVASYNGNVLKGVVRLKNSSYQTVHGWAYIDIKTTDTDILGSDILNQSMCSSIQYSPTIAISVGENLWGLGVENKFINIEGAERNNVNFRISDYIPILKKDINLYSVCGGNTTSYAALAFYTLDKTFISVFQNGAGISTDFTLSASSIPDKAAFIRVNSGSGNTYPFISMVDNEKEILAGINSNSGNVNVFNSLHGIGELGEDDYLLLNKVHISKNILYTAHITGTIQNISVGNGYIENGGHSHPNNRGFNAMWVNITPTQVLFYENFSTSETLTATYDHGLTLGNETTVSIVSHFTETGLSAKILLSDGKGNLFDHSLPSWGLGRPFAQNLGTSSLNVEMRFMPTDIYCPVWIFGDSYLGYTNNNRWLYYAVQNGFSHFLLNSRPGENAEEGWYDLQSLISAGGKPKTLCWCLGMNGDGVEQMVDGQYVINTFQKTYIDNVKELCDTFGIEPVFSTIPTVPSLQKTGLSNYVRNLGCRYIDFAEAVGANSSGVWKTGMLSSDEVHPTTLGAEALASRAFLDCPEIAEGMILLT